MNPNKSATPFDVNGSGLKDVNLIEASAGTGKTYTIGCLYIRGIVEQSLSVENILVVTFTEAATSELRGRIREKIREAIQCFESGESDDPFFVELLRGVHDHSLAIRTLKGALARFEEARIFTIHGFCKRILADFAFESGARYDTEFIKDQGPLVEEITLDYWRSKMYSNDSHLPALVVEIFKRPDNVSKLLTSTLNKPVSQIITGVDTEGPLDLLDQLKVSFQDLSACWPENIEVILEYLSKSPSISHRSYQARYLKSWMGQLANYISKGNPYLIPEKLERFTRSSVESAAKNPVEDPVPNNPVYSCCEQIQRAFSALKPAFEKEFIEYGREELRKRKWSRNVQFFDDLLTSVSSALKSESGHQLIQQARMSYKMVMIDEFQDTDPVQYDIFNRLFGGDNPNLFYIGDPKQSIYAFRGADIFAYLTAQNQADHKYTLGQNWRTDGDLITAINSVFQVRDNPFLFKGIEFLPVAPSGIWENRSLLINGHFPAPFQFWRMGSDTPVSKTDKKREVAGAVAGEIVRLLNLSKNGEAGWTGKAAEKTSTIRPMDIAVLVRSHPDGEVVRQSLLTAGIPCVLKSKASLFQSEEFQQFITIIKAIVYPNHTRLIKAALVTPVLGANGDRLVELAESEHEWEQVLASFRSYHQEWTRFGFYRMIQRFTREENVRVKLIRLANGERRITNFLHAVEWAREAVKTDIYGMARLIRKADMATRDTVSSDESELRLETDDNAVQVMTIHASKGLEFPIVFCPFPWSEPKADMVFYHDPENDSELFLDLGSKNKEKRRTLAENEGLAEEIRLLYVALTRAKHRCYVAWGNIKNADKSALAYLLHSGKLADADIDGDLEKLVASANGAIEISPLPSVNPLERYVNDTFSAESSCRKFGRKLRRNWGITSFTRLSNQKQRHLDIESPDRDAIATPPLENPDETKTHSIDHIIGMPGGTKTGNFFHEILEELDFISTDSDQKSLLVQSKMEKYGIETDWFMAIQGLIDSLLKTNLFTASSGEDVSLSKIPMTRRISELDFYFPVEQLETKGLIEVIKSIYPLGDHILINTLKQLDFTEMKGFMKGFVDLIFEWDGRYYIIDWKTNQLGLDFSNYAPDQLESYMIDHQYVLQYYIYSLALHRFLSMKLAGYKFDQHFGGVFYLFLRGIHSDSQNRDGVYSDTMTGMEDLLNALNLYISPDDINK